MKNIMHIKLLIGFLLLLGKEANAAPIPTKSPAKILLEGGRLHVGNGQVIENSYIGIENGKITLVKNALAYTLDKSKYDTIVNIAGQEVYPGFFAPNATLGLTEIDAVRATRDYNEVGELNPHIRALIAFNVESNVVATVRTNGVLFAQATPRGGVISGTSSVFRLDGWNWEDAVVKADDGIHLNWPTFMKRTWRDTKQNENYKKEINAIRQFFQASKAWADAPEKGKLLDLRYAAMKGLFGGEKRFLFTPTIFRNCWM
jgi:hypothetical protein